MNKQFEIATFLLEHGANINTDWSTHEPASILHECADSGIDMTIRDYRWNGTAEGWAYQAFSVGGDGTINLIGDKNMAEFLARVERARK